MVSNFRVSAKTRAPKCYFRCCGNKFGRRPIGIDWNKMWIDNGKVSAKF